MAGMTGKKRHKKSSYLHKETKAANFCGTTLLVVRKQPLNSVIRRAETGTL
jgi:hypothetical protein